MQRAPMGLDPELWRFMKVTDGRSRVYMHL
jgi:hypothetical protein